MPGVPLNDENELLSYSRQLSGITFSLEDQKALFGCRIAMYGINSVGAETFKNLEKLGVRTFFIGDPTPATERDFPGNFYLTYEDSWSHKPRGNSITSKFNAKSNSKTIAHETTLSNLQDHKYLKENNIHLVILNELLPRSDVEKINDACRQAEIKFIWALSSSTALFVFSDFGDNYTLKEDTETQPESEEEKQNDDEPNLPKVRNFKPISKYLDYVEATETYEQKLTGVDGSGYQAMHLAQFKALLRFREQFERVPRLLDQEDTDQYLKIYFEECEKAKFYTMSDEEKEECLTKSTILAAYWNSEFLPFSISAASIVSVEAIKIIGKFEPFDQLFHFTYPYHVPFQTRDAMAKQSYYISRLPKNDPFFYQKALMGSKYQQKLRDSKLVLVGAGAVGCEWVKILARMGGCAGDKGLLTVVDNDVIEKTNLHRIAIAKEEDLLKKKAEVAVIRGKELCIPTEQMNMKTIDEVMSEQTEKVFNHGFYSSLNGILIAVDNALGRQYLQNKADEYSIPIVNSGTEGFKAQSSLYIPYLSRKMTIIIGKGKEYASCTLKGFLDSQKIVGHWCSDFFAGDIAYMENVAPSFTQSVQEQLEKSLLKNDYQNVTASLITLFNDIFDKDVVRVKEQIKQQNEEKLKELSQAQLTQEKSEQTTTPLEADAADDTQNVEDTQQSIEKQKKKTEEKINKCVVISFSRNSDLHRSFITSYIQVLRIQFDLPLLTQQEIDSLDQMILKDSFKETVLSEQLQAVHQKKVFDKDNLQMLDFVHIVASLKAMNFSLPPPGKIQTMHLVSDVISSMMPSTSLATGLAALSYSQYLGLEDQINALQQKQKELFDEKNDEIEKKFLEFSFSGFYFYLDRNDPCNLRTRIQYNPASTVRPKYLFSLRGKDIKLDDVVKEIKEKLCLQKLDVNDYFSLNFFNFDISKRSYDTDRKTAKDKFIKNGQKDIKSVLDFYHPSTEVSTPFVNLKLLKQDKSLMGEVQYFLC